MKLTVQRSPPTVRLNDSSITRNCSTVCHQTGPCKRGILCAIVCLIKYTHTNKQYIGEFDEKRSMRNFQKAKSRFWGVILSKKTCWDLIKKTQNDLQKRLFGSKIDFFIKIEVRGTF